MPISMHIGCSGTSQHLWQVQVGNVNVDKAGSPGESGSLHILFWSFKSHCKDKDKGEFSFHVFTEHWTLDFNAKWRFCIP